MAHFVISDTHFGHANIINFCERPFTDANHMDEELIKRWNMVVHPGDTVYHLGDVAMTRPYIEKLARCNGRKVLVKGNHDIFKLTDYTPYFYDIRSYIVRRVGGVRYILSHIPVHERELERFKANVHGHTHEVVLDDKRYINVCVEQTDYRPVSLDRIDQMVLHGVRKFT